MGSYQPPKFSPNFAPAPKTENPPFLNIRCRLSQLYVLNDYYFNNNVLYFERTPLNESGTMVTQRISRSYALGLTFIVVVTIIWTASSITVQYLYKDLSFHSPFLLTYIGVSLFTLWLPVKMATESCQECIKNQENRGRSDTIRQHGMGGCADYYWSLCCHHLCVWRKPTIYESIPTSTPTTAAATATAVPQERTDRHSVLEEEKEEPVVFDFSSADSEVEEGLDGDDLQDNFAGGMTYHWTHADHFRTACFIAPVWFLANWTYNASLAYTSITSSTVLASTGSLFTFLFAISTNDERFAWAKLAGVLLGFFGSLCTTLNDSSSTIPDIINPENHTLDAGYILLEQQSENSSSVSDALFGDTLGLVSAIGYGAYAVQTRVLCPRDESLYSMQLLLGCKYIDCTLQHAFRSLRLQ